MKLKACSEAQQELLQVIVKGGCCLFKGRITEEEEEKKDYAISGDSKHTCSKVLNVGTFECKITFKCNF